MTYNADPSALVETAQRVAKSVPVDLKKRIQRDVTYSSLMGRLPRVPKFDLDVLADPTEED